MFVCVLFVHMRMFDGSYCELAGNEMTIDAAVLGYWTQDDMEVRPWLAR